jgi:hypothetical protein
VGRGRVIWGEVESWPGWRVGGYKPRAVILSWEGEDGIRERKRERKTERESSLLFHTGFTMNRSALPMPILLWPNL